MLESRATHARRRPADRRPFARRTRLAAIAAAAAMATGLLAPAMAEATAGSVAGSVWVDVDRDGQRGPTESPLPGVAIAISDATTGRPLAAAVTDGEGRFAVSAPDGALLVAIDAGAWFGLADDWVPTTTGSLEPVRTVVVSGSAAAADLGLRPIVRSTVEGQPISAFTGPSGLRVESYNDVIPARSVHDQLASGLLGGEAAATLVRLGLDTTNHTRSSWSGALGTFMGYTATVNAAYRTWIDDGGASLSHEYGHAWSMYQTLIAQQDDTLAAYLAARGLAGDPRLGSDVYWQPRELVAEDYRQLLGPAAGRARPQANSQLASAAEVPGLAAWLRDVFPTPVTATGGGASSPPPPEPDPVVLQVSALAVSPLPVTTSAAIGFNLSAAASVDVRVVDLRGRVVRTIAAGAPAASGAVSLGWDRRDDRGRKVKAATYRLVVHAVDASGAAADAAADLLVK
jgi:hypothetical protein